MAGQATTIGTVLVVAFAGFAGCFQKAGEPRSTGTASSPSDPFTRTSVFPGVYDTNGRYSMVLRPGPHAARPPEIVTLPSLFDSQPIQFALVRPDLPASWRVPVILSASPYFADFRDRPLRDTHTSNPTQIESFLLDNYVPHGYAVAFLAVRGTGGSGGCYEWWGEGERRDLNQTINWLGMQPWSNGRVGMVGLSHGGATAWEAAGQANDHLVTIVPMASETDLYSWMVRNGQPTIVAAPAGTGAFWAFFSLAPAEFEGGPFVQRNPDRLQAGYQCPGAVEGLAASLYSSTTGGVDPTGYWSYRDLRPDVERRFEGSIFLIHGFRDGLAYPHLVLPWASALPNDVKIWIGQWQHKVPDDLEGGLDYNPTSRADFAETLLHWFDHYLKGFRGGLGPRVQVADDQGRWRNEDAWPPRASSAKEFFLTDAGALAEEQSPRAATFTLTPDPARSVTGFEDTPFAAEPCETCVTFDSQPFENETRFDGIPRLNLTVIPLGPGGHVTAHLQIVTGTRAKRVDWGTMNLHFAHGGKEPKPVTPNAPVRVAIDMEPVDLVVPQGSFLRLEVFQGGYGDGFQRYAQNGSLSPAAYYRMPLASNPVQLSVGPSASRLELAEIHPPSSAYFEPPVMTVIP